MHPIDERLGRVVDVAIDDELLYVGDWRGVHTFRYDVERRAPILTFDQRTLSLGSRSDSEKSLERSVRLINEGTLPAKIPEVGVSGPGFELVDSIPSVLEPGESLDIKVGYAQSEENARGLLTVCDSTGPRTVKLKANEKTYGKGKSAPDVVLQLTDGGSRWRLEDQRGKPVLLVYFATF